MKLCSRSRLKRNAVAALFMYTGAFILIYTNFIQYLTIEDTTDNSQRQIEFDITGMNEKIQEVIKTTATKSKSTSKKREMKISTKPTPIKVDLKQIKNDNPNKQRDLLVQKDKGHRPVQRQSKTQEMKLKKSYQREFKYPMEIDLKKLVLKLEIGNKSDIQPINEHNFHFMYSPDHICEFDKNLTTLRLLILVKSSVQNMERRNVIRTTWGKLLEPNIRLVFLLGLPTQGNLPVRVESSTYGDVVQEDFIDNYRNNTVKMIMGYKWAVSKCESADMLFFVDDDYFVNTENLQNYFRSGKVSPGDRKTLFSGTLLPSSVPYRASGSKWFISWEQYPFDRWPPYIAGGAYFVSMHLARKFHLAFPYVKPMHIDDVYLGITAKKLGITPRQNRQIGYRKQGKASQTRLIACHGYEKRIDVESAMAYLNQQKQQKLQNV